MNKWSIGKDCNSREIPLEVKRRFAWVFANDNMPACVDLGAIIDLYENGDVFLNWNEIVFKIVSPSKIEELLKKIYRADSILQKDLPLERGKWNFASLNKKQEHGFSNMLAAKSGNFEKIFCYQSVSSDIEFNPELASKIEVIPDDQLPWDKVGEELLWVEFALCCVEEPLALIESIKESKAAGITMINDCVNEEELPRKAAKLIEGSGFSTKVLYGTLLGLR